MVKELTRVQKDICNTDGKFVVRACPGSGKTFTVAAKMAQLLKNWRYSHQGVAVISFTNVAWEEIQKELETTFSVNIPIKHPHFLGTIDSFINNFIFFPYGHLMLDCKHRPRLVGEPVYPWKNKKGFHNGFFDKVSRDINGNFVTNSRIIKLNNPKHYKGIQKMKKSFWKRGYVNQSDVDYFSMKLFEKYPSIAKTIGLRFPYIIIDEAQDTSGIQSRIIEILAKNEDLKNIILVGDPDQAIFEWNGAKSELLHEKSKEWNNSITMNESLRSSKKICKFTYHLSTLPKESDSVNDEVSNYEHEPEIWGYDSNNPDFNKLISFFLGLCESKNIDLNPEDVAVLCRSKTLIEDIIFSRNKDSVKKRDINFWYQDNFAKELLHSKYLYDNLEFEKSFNLLGKTYMSILEGHTIYSDHELSELIEKRGYFDFRKELFDLISLMPKTDKPLGEWITKFKKNLKNKEFTPNLDNDLKIKNKGFKLCFDDVFGYEDNLVDKTFSLSTIHKVKGKTFEAVLLILRQKTKGPLYRTLLNDNKKTSDDEELRNVYVGITRPRRILVLAVPLKDKPFWDNYFSGKLQKTLFDF